MYRKIIGFTFAIFFSFLFMVTKVSADGESIINFKSTILASKDGSLE